MDNKTVTIPIDPKVSDTIKQNPELLLAAIRESLNKPGALIAAIVRHYLTLAPIAKEMAQMIAAREQGTIGLEEKLTKGFEIVVNIHLRDFGVLPTWLISEPTDINEKASTDSNDQSQSAIISP